MYEFGPFRLDLERELLFREGEPVAIAPKALQILLVLIRRAKQLVTKDELMQAIWPDTLVEEGNLSRKASFCAKRSEKARRIANTCYGREARLPVRAGRAAGGRGCGYRRRRAAGTGVAMGMDSRRDAIVDCRRRRRVRGSISARGGDW